MEELIAALPEEMRQKLDASSKWVRSSKTPLAISHIDADGISALAIVVKMLERQRKQPVWRNIHQLNSETVIDVRELVRETHPDLVIFTDLGTGQIELIIKHIAPEECIKHIIVLDHHLPSGQEETRHHGKIIEINPALHGLSGSQDVSGAGVAFLLAMSTSVTNVDLSELAVVGASGDLQDYYGKGMTGINEDIVRVAKDNGIVRVDRDLTFFGVNTRPLPVLLEYATEPYLPGITGNREACYRFFLDRKIELKEQNDEWRTWSDLKESEKRVAIQGLIEIVLDSYEDPRVSKGIIGDVLTLLKRPTKSEMRSAKEFSTLLNACGRNRQAEVGVKICLGSEEAYAHGRNLLQQHRANLAQALRRLETDGYKERKGMYVIQDPLTPDTIIGIVIGMAQGARIIPEDRPVIGICPNPVEDSPMLKISGRAQKSLVNRGVNLKDAFAGSAEVLNQKHGQMLAEGGGHPMAAGAFVHHEYLDEFLDIVDESLAAMLSEKQEA